MSSSDRSWSDLEETTLEGEKISCFAVGGEYRLCLPQILNSVLEKVSLQDINQACDQLQIFCSTCSADQLQVLKDATVLPVTAHQCGLITKSDAERLCSHLLDKSPPRASVFDPKSSPFSFKVQHECFGRCEGLVLPEAYTSPTARCVECLQCEGLFSPQKFVCHSHSPENRTCHWGFDSSNWLTYLQLSEDYTKEEKERHTKVMEDFKNRYQQQQQCPALRTPQQGPPVREGKRRQDDSDQYEKMPAPTKRAKLESGPGDPYTAYMKALNQAKAKASLNWPWPAKPGVPSFPGLPPHSYPAPPPPPHTEFRRPEEVREAVVSREERYGDSPQPKQAKYAISPIEKVEPVEPVERFSQPALAEEISTVAEALAGAPKHATETVLKILERLTQRLDKAERDRDLAFGKYKELQTRYAQLEEELAKKRGELRELLRQDCRPPSPRPIDTEPAQKSRTNGATSVDDQSRGSSAEERGGGQGANLTVIVARLGEAGRLGEASSRSEGGEDSTAGKQDEAQPGSLPKLEVKSPSHLLEDAPVSPPRLPPNSSVSSSEAPVEEIREAAVREEILTKFHKHLAHKAKDPEEALQNRMVKMEAELTALREALSTRTDKKEQAVVANVSEKEVSALQVQGVQGIQQVQGLNGGNGDVGGAQRLQIAE